MDFFRDVTQTEKIGFLLPIIFAIIDWLLDFYKNYSGGKKQWKCKEHMSPLNCYCRYLILMILSGILVCGIYVLILFIYIILRESNIKIEHMHILFTVISIIFYLLLFCIMQRKDKKQELNPMTLKRTYKTEKAIKIFLRYGVLVSSGIMWSFVFIDIFPIIFKVALIIMLLCEVTAVFVLDSVKKPEYRYACFYLNDTIKQYKH